MKKITALLLFLSTIVFAQKPAFKVLAFYSNKVERDHVDFSKQARAFFNSLSDEQNFTFDVTTDWTNLNDTLLRNYQVVMWINDFPHSESQRRSFEKYMEHGGGWIGFHVAGYNDKTTGWPWFVDFMGGAVFYTNSWPVLPARLVVDDVTHAVTTRLPAAYGSPANEWYQWKPSPRENKNVKVLVTLDPMNYPIGIKDILTGGDTPVVWTNTKYNMIYINMGHGDQVLNDNIQNNLITDALMWLGKSKMTVKKTDSITPALCPEMITVQGGKFTMGDNAGANDEKPAHDVTVGSFSLAKTETTNAQWRAFCNATGRKMPEGVFFPQSENHPVVNVSWDQAVAYCLWLSEQTGKQYRLPTEAEWEFAAKGGVKSRGYAYSGGKTPDSVAWYSSKSAGTMPVALKLPNELGLYDMTGNVWEWCSDWYDAGYYSVSPKENPEGPSKGTFYTLRGGAWDQGARSCKITYRNPLSPSSRNHNKGFRVAADHVDKK